MTEAQYEFLALLNFARGVIAERMGLVGDLNKVIHSQDIQSLASQMRFIENFEDWSMWLTMQD